MNFPSPHQSRRTTSSDATASLWIWSHLMLLLAMSAAGSALTGCSEQHVHTIKYEVTGTASTVSLTYANSSEGTSQADSALPWTYSFTTKKDDQFLYISAQNQNETGSVIVRIYHDGAVEKESTSTAAFGIATASGTPKG